MSIAWLPDRPDLAQLRRQAKELRDAARAGDRAALDRLARHVPGGDPTLLATTQLAIARERGFSSWPAMRAEVLARTSGLAEQVQAFLYESVAGHGDRAVRLLRENPSIATYDFRTAVVLGEAAAVRRMLAKDPVLASRADRTTGWPPLLGACMSRWPSIDPQRSAGIRDVAALLLDAGADPNTTVGSRPGRPDYCSTLFGAAGCRGNAALTALLLDRGATADAHTVYLAAFHPDHVALELLLEHGASVDDTALAAPLTTGDVEVARLLVDAGADAVRMIPPEALGEGDPGELPLVVAVRNGHSAKLIELLIERGADPNAPGRGGRTPHRLAVRRGRADLARALRRGGARARGDRRDRSRPLHRRLPPKRPDSGRGSASSRLGVD